MRFRGFIFATEYVLLLLSVLLFIVSGLFVVEREVVSQASSLKSGIMVVRANAERVDKAVVIKLYIRNTGATSVQISNVGVTDGLIDCPMKTSPVTINPGEVKLVTASDICNIPSLKRVFVYVDLGTYRVGTITPSDMGTYSSPVPPLIFYNYEYSDTPQFTVRIDYSSNDFIIYSSSGTVVTGGVFLIFPPGSDITYYLRMYGVVAVSNPNPNSSQIISVYANYLHNLYLPAVPGAIVDMILVWEDLVGTNPPGSPNIDGNGDEWVRVSYFPNGTWRISVYIASGGYRHAFYIGDTMVYDKPYGASWSNMVNDVYYEINQYGLPKYVTIY